MDPFNFAQILSNTRSHFSDLEYTELFCDSDTFYISNNNKKFSKDRFIDHLDEFSNKYSFNITWIPDSTRDSTALAIRDTVMVNATYRINAKYSDEKGEEKEINMEARSTFRLVFYQNRWTIFTFKDGFAGQSIFHPEYKSEK